MYKLSNVRNAELIKGFIIIIIIVLFFTLFWWRGGLKEQNREGRDFCYWV